MIEIHQDALRFSFSAIAAEMEALIAAHVADVLPSLLAEDRRTVIQEVLDATRDRNSYPFFQKKNLRKMVLGLSPADIEHQLRECARPRNVFRRHFPPGHVQILFKRTLRIPDNGMLPPFQEWLGNLPLRHVDDYAGQVPRKWLKRGGVLMPMYQSEALWMRFHGAYPFAIKIAAGKINAVSGRPWRAGLRRQPQDYVVTPGQLCLDGFAVAEGGMRQFVAPRLCAGYSVEEQLSGKAEFGGIQLQVIPMKARRYFETQVLPQMPKRLADLVREIIRAETSRSMCFSGDIMGLGAGGRIRQQVYKDPHAAEDWDFDQGSRCFVHLCDALMWRKITGERPPHAPFSAIDYERLRLPWFDFYRDDLAVLEGSKTLAGIQSVNAISRKKTGRSLKGNASVKVPSIIDCGTGKMKTAKEWTGQ